eukprot:TRINITY_DN9845_c0_g1_i4.p1 TRINITY_DN9845_c0_g1~~TRINITY_DN9845_c0_g1_i4.p1  ORF type:complete len:177 (-),score=25.57 TRINITY_DN9845_c0_g1_i4:6-536(-)
MKEQDNERTISILDISRFLLVFPPRGPNSPKDIIDANPGLLNISRESLTYRKYLAYDTQKIQFFGKIDNENESKCDGIMIWSDGFTHEGRWNVNQAPYIHFNGLVPETLIVHPKIQKCLQQKCSTFCEDWRTNGPHIMYETSSGSICGYCANNCGLQVISERWFSSFSCTCDKHRK